MDEKDDINNLLAPPQAHSILQKKSDRSLLRHNSGLQSRRTTSMSNDPDFDEARQVLEDLFRTKYGAHKPRDVLDILDREVGSRQWTNRSSRWICFCICFPRVFKGYFDLQNRTNALLEALSSPTRLQYQSEIITTLRGLDSEYYISAYALRQLVDGAEAYDEWIQKIEEIETMAESARISIQKWLSLIQNCRSGSKIEEDLISSLQNYQTVLDIELKANIADAKDEMHRQHQLLQHPLNEDGAHLDVESSAAQNQSARQPGIWQTVIQRTGLEDILDGYRRYGVAWSLVSLLASKFCIVAITTTLLAASLVTHAFGVKSYYAEQESNANDNSTFVTTDESGAPNYDSNFYTSLSQTIITILSNYTAIIPVLYDKSTYGINRRPPIKAPNLWWTIIIVSTISAVIASAVYPYEGKGALILSWLPAALAVIAALQTIWSVISNNKKLHVKNKELVEEAEFYKAVAFGD